MTHASHGLTTFDADELRRFAKRWEALFDGADAANMAASYAADALLVATGTPTVHGRAAIEAFWRQSCERARSSGLVRTVHPQHAERDGALGYSRGEVRMELPGSALRVVRYVTVWKQQADGIWRCAIDISTQDPDREQKEPS